MASEFLKSHFDTEGPLGLPMKGAQAKMLEGIVQSLPDEDRQICRLVTTKAPTELMDGERADVSWISTEAIDREKEVVVARGMNDSHFKLNLIVTLDHNYWIPPVAKLLWRKRVKDGELVGIKAKTQYPEKPKEWPDKEWEPDCIFVLVKAGPEKPPKVAKIVPAYLAEFPRTQADLRATLDLLVKAWSDELADSFSARKLDLLRRTMLEEGWTRQRIKIGELFRWAAQERMVVVEAWMSVKLLSPIKYGRTTAPEEE